MTRPGWAGANESILQRTKNDIQTLKRMRGENNDGLIFRFCRAPASPRLANQVAPEFCIMFCLLSPENEFSG